ncbi:RluA family pseudouridine synthase [bacterium]|nr:RluA family pseudouridine synthase [candidate division CSSED10-310 bacterium]
MNRSHNLIRQITLIYEDDHLIAVYKPPGVLAQSDATGDLDLLTYTKTRFMTSAISNQQPFLGLIHRLDRPVAGIVVFGKTRQAAAELSRQFRERTAEKIYWAVVHGIPRGQGILENFIARDKIRRMSRIARPGENGAKSARLSYTVLGSRSGRSLLEIQLLSGRSHQIRIQLSHRGYPVLADRKYGSHEVLKNPGMIALWAKNIMIRHPADGRQLQLESPRPRHWPWFDPR